MILWTTVLVSRRLRARGAIEIGHVQGLVRSRIVD